MEDEMGMAAADDADHERIVNHVIEKEIVFNNLLGKFHPFIAFIVANENQKSNKSVAVGSQKDGSDGPFSAPIIRETSLLALSRYMCVSNALCEMYLPLLFTVLEREPEAVNRTTIMIALADLAFRFPNAVEPWVNRMFARLSDENTYVRYNTLMVLTHLILNDMVKVKGQVSHVVICLTDPDDRIRELSTLFFVKLSERSNNPIYNLLGDIIATLSRDVPVSTANSSSLTTTLKSEEGASGSERGNEGKVAQGEGGKDGEVKGQEEEDGTGPMDVDEDGDTSKQILSTAASAGDTVTDTTTDTGRGDKMVMATEDDNEVVAVAVVDIDESSLPSKVLSQKEFQNTLHFLLSFVKKDKQADLLFERLIVRLSLAQTVRQRRNIAYCISELTVSQKGLKKLIESFKTLREALHDSQVFDCIRSTVSKAKRAFSFRSGGAAGGAGGGEEDGTGVVLPPVTAAGEGKGVVEELENLLKEFGVVKSSSAGGEEGEEREDRGENEGGEEEGEGVRTVSKSVRSKGKGGQGGVGRGKSGGGVKKGKVVAKKGRRRGDSSDEESEEEEEEEEEAPKKAAPIKKPNQTQKQNKSKKVQSDSESEEDELDFE
jgi:non-SMC mitotic condensation complex subunit 1